MVLKVYHFHKRAFLLTVHDVSNNATVALAKQKQTKWCLVPKILFNQSSSSRKRLRQLMNNDTASLQITVNVHESALSWKFVFWTSN